MSLIRTQHDGTSYISLEDGWREIKLKAINVLENALREGFDTKQKAQKVFSPHEYVNIYTICYNMCTQNKPYNWSDELYRRHGDVIEEYIEGTVIPALSDKHGEFLLKELVRRWEDHKIMNSWLHKFFMYLDRYHVQYQSIPTLSDSGLKKFKSLVYDLVKDKVIKALLELIKADREGAIIDNDLMVLCLDIFSNMGMGTLDTYHTDFEGPLIASTEEYYAHKSQVWVVQDSTPDYLIKVENILKSEKQRVATYLHPVSEIKLLSVCMIEMLEKHQMALLEREGSGCRALLENERTEDLTRLYSLFWKIKDGLEPVGVIVKNHIEEKGMEHVAQREARIEGGEHKDTDQDHTFIKELLSLHDRFMSTVSQQFEGHSLLQRALKDAFVTVVNKNVGQHTNATLMSSYCNKLLRTGGAKLSEEEIEEQLVKVIQVFSYLTDKDLFAEFYRNQLAKRLLNQRSASNDAELSMIMKLKVKCGSQFTSKMQGMMMDLAIGADHKTEFEEHLKALPNNPLGKMEFSVQVLTTGYWPTYKDLSAIRLPPQLTKATQIFNDYYQHTTNKRKLVWSHSLGGATIRGTFCDRTYDLQVTTLQACALMLFSTKPGFIPFTKICTLLRLSEDVVKRIMHSLSCGKYKVIKHTTESGASSKSIKTTDLFGFNDEFFSSLRKFQIPMASLEESHNSKRISEDRKFAIDAAIVRTMKARKALDHQQLVGEVLSQLASFKPQAQTIKSRIEALIEREYLERDPNQPNIYKYLA